jgi:hypothetical protein
MKNYIGVKIVRAKPAIKDGKDGYKVVYEDGYESWCPKAVFEKHNRQTDNMSFGFALEAVRQGQKIARMGWNGKGMYVVYKPGYPDGVPCNAATAKAHGIAEGQKIYYRPYFEISMVDRQFVPWVPSVSDVLADDWYVIEE